MIKVFIAGPTGAIGKRLVPQLHAALLAIDRGEPGIFNIAEEDGFVSIDKAIRELGFDPGFRAHGKAGPPSATRLAAPEVVHGAYSIES